jgi:hypothetical protein
MKTAVANVGIAIAADVTMLASRRALEQPWAPASVWPHLGVIPEPVPQVCPQESEVLPNKHAAAETRGWHRTSSTQHGAADQKGTK